ncbi:rod-determining factor RdfA [Natronorubrum halophilum]|uniref:rod-determining factor RdfA n=1 Tax=Natronorubrum halophilum TaxID=1702106 RepID=UPI0010C1AC64|nr:rod-determining factor RdfA [Natronorubrum halophilum]
MAPENDAAGGTTNTKVGRLIDRYDLGREYGEELEAAWTADGSERKSLRDLAEEFNHRVLASAMDEAAMSPLDGEVDNIYRLLTQDEVTAGVRTEVRGQLERNGIDVNQLERDFVTYQAIRSYLQNECGAEYERTSNENRIERTADSINNLQARLSSVCETNLDQLRDTDRITLDDYHLFVSVDVLCEACDSQYTVSELLERGGCDCDETERR